MSICKEKENYLKLQRANGSKISAKLKLIILNAVNYEQEFKIIQTNGFRTENLYNIYN